MPYWKPPLTSKSPHGSFSQVECRERGMGSGDLVFLLASQMTWDCKTQYHPFHLGLWKQWSPWAHPMCPKFLSFISSPISSVAVYTSAQVHGKWSVSVNDFFFYVRERPIRQIQWDKFREFVSPVTFRSGCAVEHRRKTDLSRWAASPGRSLSQWRDSREGWKTSTYQHFRLGTAQGAEQNCLWMNLNKSESQSPMQGGMGRHLYISKSLGGTCLDPDTNGDAVISYQ